ncbi:uncharacterized protein LOC144865756 isoform X2 [Branchiostoma floridae x Branchiostoma japonicum]
MTTMIPPAPPLWTVVYIIVYCSLMVTSVPVDENSVIFRQPRAEDLCEPCPPGHYMEKGCPPDSDTPSCIPCPDGTYRGEYNHAKYCDPHKTICDAPYQRKKPVQPGNKTHDALCHCKHGTRRVNNNKCVKTCPAGKGVTKDGRCKRCKKGTFSDKRSNSQECLPIRNCASEGRETLQAGSQMSDAVCGDQLTQQSTFDDPERDIQTMFDMLREKAEQLEKMQEETIKFLSTLFAKSGIAIAEALFNADAPASLANENITVMVTNSSSPGITEVNVAGSNDGTFTKFPKADDRTVPVGKNYKSWTHASDIHVHIDQGALPQVEVLEATVPPDSPADNRTLIYVVIALTVICLIAIFISVFFGVINYRHLTIIHKKIDGPPTHQRGDFRRDTADNEEIEEVMPPLSQEQSSRETASPHADLQGPPAGAEGMKEIDSSKKEVEVHPSTVPAAVVRPKQRSLTGQPQATSSEEDLPQYSGSANDETVPLLLRGSQDISSPMDPAFKNGGLEVALHPTPPLKEDAGSLSSLTEDATESSVPKQTLAEELQETEEQSTEDVPDGPSDAGPQSEPIELRIEEEDEEETSVKGPPEDIPDIEEIARTAMVRVPSDELSFPVQESAHDSDGLEALGAVGGRSESFSPLPTSDVESDAESSSGDEAYERKVRVAIRDSVAKSLFTGLAHHLSNPAGPGPDWVPLARAAGITGPEIDHIINEAAQDLDKDIRKMLQQYEEGKTGDRPISELYGELIARKRLELYNKFRRDPPS